MSLDNILNLRHINFLSKKRRTINIDEYNNKSLLFKVS